MAPVAPRPSTQVRLPILVSGRTRWRSKTSYIILTYNSHWDHCLWRIHPLHDARAVVVREPAPCCCNCNCDRSNHHGSRHSGRASSKMSRFYAHTHPTLPAASYDHPPPHPRPFPSHIPPQQQHIREAPSVGPGSTPERPQRSARDTAAGPCAAVAHLQSSIRRPPVDASNSTLRILSPSTST